MIVLIWMVLAIYGIWCLVAFAYAMYASFGICKRFFHDWLGFHIPDDRTIREQGDRRRCRCRVCHMELILTDDGVWVVLE